LAAACLTYYYEGIQTRAWFNGCSAIFEKEQNVEYLSSIERHGFKQGLEKGPQKKAKAKAKGCWRE